MKLEAGMRADDGVRAILGELLAEIRANEPGVLTGEDPEHLHDFRVAVRRTRACLGQLKGVLAAAVTTHHRAEFAWLGKVTGPTRDLDVYLLKMQEYREELSPELAAGLAPLEALLRERLQVERARLIEALESERYRELLRSWHGYLDRPGDAPDPVDAPNAQRPIEELAAKKIWRAFKRVRRRGKALEPATPAAEFHRLRIDCKKLRYLLEFFRSLFPKKQVRSPIAGLKRLQEKLGDFNDLDVQQRQLQELPEKTMTGLTVKAVAALSATLRRREQELKRALVPAIAEFLDRENVSLFRSAFKQ